MQRLYSLAILVLTAVSLASGDTAKPTAAAKKKSSAVAVAKRKKTAAPATASSRSRTATTGPRQVVVTRKKVNGKWVRSTRIVRPPAPTYQLRPDTERYQQIQQALAEKGFYKGEANGEWGDDSVDALKRFQSSANLPNDGKIGSLSLISLGLGPKHDGSITPPTTAPANPSQP